MSAREVLATLRELFAAAPPQLGETRLAGDRAVLRIVLPDEDKQRWFTLSLDERGLIGELQGYSSEASLQHDLAILAGGAPAPAPPPAPVSLLIPFVHVSDMRRSVASTGGWASPCSRPSSQAPRARSWTARPAPSRRCVSATPTGMSS